MTETGQEDALKDKAKKEYTDVSAGKEDIVKKDLEDIGKVQLKYRDVADARFLPKRPPNKMKGKPFVERIVPGLSLQVLNGQNVSVDVSPFLGYRFSGSISAGIGFYRRIAYVEKDDALRALDWYGVRVYNQIRIIKGISTHVELERYTPNVVASVPPHIDEDKWGTKLNLGLHQRYRMGKKFYGHFLIMYDLMQIRKFPNSTGSSIRFGFDYQIKKKKKKPVVEEK